MISVSSVVNPSYFGFDLLRETYIPALGMGAWWTLFVLTLHTVWSISAPIVVIESFVPCRATTPWLGWLGLAISSILFVLGSALIFWGTYKQEHFVATTPQLLGVVASVVVVIAIAFVVRPSRIQTELPAPLSWWVGAFALMAASSFMAARDFLADWPLVVAYLLIFGLVGVMVVRWSRRIGWGSAHRLALAGGTLLTYAWHSFPEKPVFGSNGTIDLIGNAVFSLIAVALIASAARAVTKGEIACDDVGVDHREKSLPEILANRI